MTDAQAATAVKNFAKRTSPARPDINELKLLSKDIDLPLSMTIFVSIFFLNYNRSIYKDRKAIGSDQSDRNRTAKNTTNPQPEDSDSKRKTINNENPRHIREGR